MIEGTKTPIDDKTKEEFYEYVKTYGVE
jgi:hypothetical protein